MSFKLNKECPNCGQTITKLNKIQSIETGLNYCSHECANKHVNKNYHPELLKEMKPLKINSIQFQRELRDEWEDLRIMDEERLLKWLDEEIESYKKPIKRKIRPSKKNKQRKYCLGNINALKLVKIIIERKVYTKEIGKENFHEDRRECGNCKHSSREDLPGIRLKTHQIICELDEVSFCESYICNVYERKEGTN